MIPSKLLWILISTLFAIFSNCYGCDDATFNQSDYLDNNKTIYVQWKSNNTHLTMKVSTKTQGWVGLGFTPSRSIKGADMVIAWVKNGETYIQDRHVEDDKNGLLLLDNQQDYILKEGKENNTHTVFCFERKLDTCDQDDYKITMETIQVIYVFNYNDPENENEDDFKYDENNIGISSQNILFPIVKKPTGSDVKYVDFKLPNVSIPESRDTYYWCQFFKLPPELKTKHHLIGYEIVFAKGQESVIHHLSAIQCVGNNIKDNLKNATGFECYVPTSPIPHDQCQTYIFSWSVGMKPTFFPDNVGYPFVNQINGEDLYYMFAAHLDNPEKKSIQVNSGIRIYYTSKLRPNDAWTVLIGYTLFNPYLIIPPGQKQFLIPGHCAKECLEAVMTDNDVRIFGLKLHTHLAGRIMKIRHFRNGKELEPLADNEHYDFNYQQIQMLDKERDLLPGDSVTFECIYTTEERNFTTIGGESTRQEMCAGFLMVYPALQLGKCLSYTNADEVNDLLGIKEIYPITDQLNVRIKEPANLNNTQVAEYLKTYNWTDDQIAKLQERIWKTKHIIECKGPSSKIDLKGIMTVGYPNATEYKEEDSCTGNKI